MAISTAVFPSLIRAAKSDDKARLSSAIVRDMSLIMFFVIPSAAIAVVMRGYIAVSYTHLDVYKRQVLCNMVKNLSSSKKGLCGLIINGDS